MLILQPAGNTIQTNYSVSSAYSQGTNIIQTLDIIIVLYTCKNSIVLFESLRGRLKIAPLFCNQCCQSCNAVQFVTKLALEQGSIPERGTMFVAQIQLYKTISKIVIQS